MADKCLDDHAPHNDDFHKKAVSHKLNHNRAILRDRLQSVQQLLSFSSLVPQNLQMLEDNRHGYIDGDHMPEEPNI